MPDSEVFRIRALPQVAEVMPVRLKMTSCLSSTDMIAIHGVDKDIFTVFKKYNLDEKALESFRTDKSGALLGEKIARRYGWKIGQNVTLAQLNGISFNVSGIFSTAGAADDFVILMGRRFLQEAEDDQGMSHYAAIKIKEGVDSISACNEIDSLPLTVQTTTLPERAHLSSVLSQLTDLVKISKIVVAVIVGVVLIAIGNSISMVTRDRSNEFGTLRTLGFQKADIIKIVLGESVIQAFLGALAGCLIVQILDFGGFVQTISTCDVSLEFSAGINEWLFAVPVIVLAAVIGSIVPAWNAASLDIVKALRRDD
ncbi:ABC transporter permease [Verrucomicrobiota bacterium]